MKLSDSERADIKEKLQKLVPIFAKASVGDFSTNLEIPEIDDPFIEIFVGVQVMLEVIREKMKEFTDLNNTLESRVKEKAADYENQAINLQKINKQLEREKAVLTSIGDGVITTDSQGYITLVNDNAQEMLGYTDSQIIGKMLTDIFPLLNQSGKVIPNDKRPMNQALQFGKKVSDKGYYIKKDGSKLPISFTVTPIILDNKIVGTIKIFRDITQEEAIDRAKTEFVSLASHQLRTPTTTIQWYTERLLGTDLAKNMNNDQKKYLNEIYDASNKMRNLINSLLNVSRLELGTFVAKPEALNLVESMKTNIHDLSLVIEEKRIQIQENYQVGLPNIGADPRLLDVIFQNLLSNAIKYTPDGGKLIISISYDHDSFTISIADSGYGILPADQPKIFTKLFRGENAKLVDPDGTGLGLYIVKSIIFNTGGTIWFTSKEGIGTTFFIKYPINGMKEKQGEKYLE